MFTIHITQIKEDGTPSLIDVNRRVFHGPDDDEANQVAMNMARQLATFSEMEAVELRRGLYAVQDPETEQVFAEYQVIEELDSTLEIARQHYGWQVHQMGPRNFKITVGRGYSYATTCDTGIDRGWKIFNRTGVVTATNTLGQALDKIRDWEQIHDRLYNDNDYRGMYIMETVENYVGWDYWVNKMGPGEFADRFILSRAKFYKGRIDEATDHLPILLARAVIEATREALDY